MEVGNKAHDGNICPENRPSWAAKKSAAAFLWVIA